MSFKKFLETYSSILFLNSKLIFIIIILSLFINPFMSICGVIAIFTSISFIQTINASGNDFLKYSFYNYNALLTGLSIGYIFPTSVESICLVVVSAILTFIICYTIGKIFSSYHLPVLSLPFSIVSITIYIASIKFLGFSNHLLNDLTNYDIYLPTTISSFLKTLGAIFFLPSNIVGLAILFIILISSRIMFFITIFSYFVGVSFESFFTGSFKLSLNNLYAFNYILTGMALYGVFLLPTFRSLLITMLAIASTVIVTNMFEIILDYYATPVFTLPFSIITIAFVFTLRNLGYKDFNYSIQSTPEKSFLNYLNIISRFAQIPKICLPFSGKWYIYQGFNDKWTHKGKYRFAYDFVKKENGKTYRDNPNFLENYLCFGESILSPDEGYIVDCRHNLMDNPIGTIDKTNNWGNYIIIKNHQGLFIKICHIMKFSITVKIGDYVRVNDILAKCGNSGYSPQPHIHIQMQDSISVEAKTINFCFDKFYNGNSLLSNTVPKKDDFIDSVIIDNSLKNRFLFILDDKFTYSVIDNNLLKHKINFTVRMNELSEFYFEDENKNKLYFYNDITEFYFYNYSGKQHTYLQKLFILAPKIPYINKENITYTDYIPIAVIKNKFMLKWLTFICIFNKKYSKMPKYYTMKNNSILSKNGEVKINLIGKGFEEIRYKHCLLRLTNL